MARISKCPECRRKVTLPRNVEESVLVRCPLCDGQFLLAEATPDAEEAPPELVPLVSVGQQIAGDADQPETEPGESAEEGPAVKVWEPVSEMPRIDTGTPGGEALPLDAVKADDGDESAGPMPAAGLRRARKQKNAARELLGIVLGGFGGLLLAYYGLNLFGGPRFDFAEIYLPGVKHTAKHRPDWWPRWLMFERDSGAPAPGDLRREPGARDRPAGPGAFDVPATRRRPGDAWAMDGPRRAAAGVLPGAAQADVRAVVDHLAAVV